jgi:hypothetical protein
MRRLSLLMLALILALGAVNIVTVAESFAPYIVRDALLLAVLAATLFGWQSAGWRATAALRHVMHLSAIGQILWLTGLVCMAAGGVGVGLGFGGLPQLASSIVWFLGIAMALAGVWWPGGEYAYAPPAYRWEQNSRGQFVRVLRLQADQPLAPAIERRSAWLAVGSVLLLAFALRFWNLGGLPPGCVGSECIDGVRLVDGQPLTASTPAAFNLYARLAQLLFGVTGDGLLSLRLTAAIFSALTVLAFAGVAQRLTPPIFVAPALLLLALNPWHLYAGRVSDPWLAPALLVTLALWMTLKALVHGDLRWWTAAGLAMGVLFVEAASLRLAVLLWGAVALALTLWSSVRGANQQPQLLAIVSAVVAAIGVAAPALVSALREAPFSTPDGTLDGALRLLCDQAVMLVGALLRPDVMLDSAAAGSALIVGATAGLIITGVGALVRNIRQPAAVLLVAGVALFGAAAIGVDTNQTPPRSALLPLLPLLLAIGAVALDRLLTALVTAWGRVVRPSRLVAVTGLLLLAILGVGVVRFSSELNAMQGSGSDSVQNEIARYIAQQLASADAQQTFVVPAGVFDHPSLRLLAGDAIAAGRVQPLDFGRTMPFAALPPGDVVYLTPAGQSHVLDQLRTMYPEAQVSNSALDAAWSLENRRAAFSVVTVPRQMILDSQALRLMLFPGSETAAAVDVTVATTSFDWQSRPPLPPPFTARMSASLSIAEMGMVGFAAEIGDGAALTMRIDDQLVLDSQLGLTRLSIFLPQGIHSLQIEYRSSGAPSDLRLYWQPPGSELTPLPATVLHVPALTEMGLLGDYRQGSEPTGTIFTQRKDRILGFDFGLEQPYNVHWQGKLGIARAGEYLLATLSDGPNQVTIDGILVVNGQPQDDADNAYNEGLIYLERGWHDIAIRYQPRSRAPEFRLLWHPPGASPGELSAAHLLPITGELSLADRPPPSPPALVDERLGNDEFALLRAASAWQPGARIVARTLEPLPLETVWTAGVGCGAGDNQFSAPRGLAFDPISQRIFVADAGNRRVQVLDFDGNFQPPINHAAFEELADIGFAPDGALLVLDAVAGPVFRFEADGSATTLPLRTTFYRPRGFDAAADGVIAVADTGGGRIVLLSADGDVITEHGGRDSVLSRGQPVDALRGESGLWAITAEDGRLWNLDVDGSLTAIQPTNTIDGPKMAALPGGRLVVTDPARRTFTVFAATGQPVQQFAYIDQLTLPTGIDALLIGDRLLFAVSDSLACSVSLWQIDINQLR